MAANSFAKWTNPNENLVIPNWINEEYFQNILKKQVSNFSRIATFQPIAATPAGEHFFSIMVRVVIHIESKDGTIEPFSYIVKTCFESGDSAAFANAMNLFPREQQMYQTYLPKFEELYKEANLEVKLSPNCLLVEKTPVRTTLVMEDLKQKNFTNIDRLKGMDMTHATSALQKLAELHAVSAVYHELNGPFEDIYMTSFFNEKSRPIVQSTADQRHKTYIRAMRTWDLENVEYYIETLSNPMRVFDEGLRMNIVNTKEFNVLNHGDCWANNIMFSYKENGDIEEVRFVDYQAGKWGSPAQDLWYFIVSSVSLDIQLKKFDEFIYIYHTHLTKCLKILKYSKRIPTLKDMHILMIKSGFWGVFTAVGVLTAMLLPPDKAANMDSILKGGSEGDELQFQHFTNPYYMKAVCQLYPFFDVKGIWKLD